MDLDTIQDLLGGSNLPPPPSVQDLLGDVVPIPRSPSPPAAPPPSLQLSAEHNYSKVSIHYPAIRFIFLCFELHAVGVLLTIRRPCH